MSIIFERDIDDVEEIERFMYLNDLVIQKLKCGYKLIQNDTIDSKYFVENNSHFTNITPCFKTKRQLYDYVAMWIQFVTNAI